MTSLATQSRLPAACVAVPIAATQLAAPVRLCALVQRGDAGGRLLGASAAADALTCAGAIVDSAGTVLRWLQWRVQLPPATDRDTNADADARWEQQARDWAAIAPAGVVWTGWEHRSPTPTWLDPDAGAPWNPSDPSGETWRPCKDDALLRSAGLPAYATSRHRYLYLPRRQLAGRFVAVSPQAPTNEHVLPMEHLVGGRNDLVPFNPGGGLLVALAADGPPTADGVGGTSRALAAAGRFDREMKDVIECVRMSSP